MYNCDPRRYVGGYEIEPQFFSTTAFITNPNKKIVIVLKRISSYSAQPSDADYYPDYIIEFE